MWFNVNLTKRLIDSNLISFFGEWFFTHGERYYSDTFHIKWTYSIGTEFSDSIY